MVGCLDDEGREKKKSGAVSIIFFLNLLKLNGLSFFVIKKERGEPETA
jgi:hypothetical protein